MASTTLAQLAASISKGEGYGASPSNRPTRTNNPGDLTGSGYAGQIGTDPQGFAIFSSPQAGQQALQQYLSQHLDQVGSGSGPYGSLTPSSTLQDFLNVYAGNPDAGYVSTVAQGVGVAPTTTLGEIQALLGAQGVVSPSSPVPASQGTTTGLDIGPVVAGWAPGSAAGVGGTGISPTVAVVGGLGALAALYAVLS